MRQTLLRILLNDLWAAHPGPDPQQGLETYFLGVGWLIVPWAIYGVCRAIYEAQKPAVERVNWLSLFVMWAANALFILLIPTLMGARVAPDGVPIRGYGFMLFLGFVAGGWTATRRATRIGVNGELIWDLGMWIFFSGIVGARLFYLVQKHDEAFGGKRGFELVLAAINLPDGGLVFYGGVLLGIVAFIVFCRMKRVDMLLMADIVIPSIFLGMAFGRIGCLLNGCCWGDRCDLPWAIQFPAGSVPFVALVERGFLAKDAIASLPLHPTQIYSSLDALMLAFLTARYFHVRPYNGAVLAVGWITYPITRFLVELLRGDEMGQFNTELTIAQWVSIGLFIPGVAFTAWLVTWSATARNAPSGLKQSASPG